jgi:hypothetical protein
MGKGDHRNSRKTRELDAVTLAGLTQSSGKVVEGADANPSLTLARTRTVDDPMTTRLLAEVARRQQTTDFDDASIDAMLETAAATEAETEAAPETVEQKETSHPHTLRRRMPSGTAR